MEACVSLAGSAVVVIGDLSEVRHACGCLEWVAQAAAEAAVALKPWPVGSQPASLLQLGLCDALLLL